MEALEVIAHVDLRKEIYESRMKRIRDERMWWNDALSKGREEGISTGREEGILKGRLMGRIELLQELSKQPVTSRADLEAMPLAALETLAARLEQEAMPPGDAAA
jgi:predicted transposase YdaD